MIPARLKVTNGPVYLGPARCFFLPFSVLFSILYERINRRGWGRRFLTCLSSALVHAESQWQD